MQLLLSRVLDLFLFTARSRDAGSQVLVDMVTAVVSDLLVTYNGGLDPLVANDFNFILVISRPIRHLTEVAL